MKYSTLVLSALAAFTGTQAQADNFVTINVTALNAATVQTRWTIGSDLSGLSFIDGNSGFPGATVTNFFSLTGATVGALGSPAGFTSYVAATGAGTPQGSIGNFLTPNRYSGLTYAAGDLGFGPLSTYTIHHSTIGDYLTQLKPGAPTVSDLKPIPLPGGPPLVGGSGYFALSYAEENAGAWGANLFYYFRTNGLGETVFGSMIPAVGSGPIDRWNLGAGRGFTDLAYTTVEMGFGVNKFYYLRLDTVTQTTFFGWLDPLTGVATDIQNLGGVYRTLAFAPTDVTFGANQFYSIGRAAQTIAFPAIADHTLCDVPFSFVLPLASSGLAVSLGITGPATMLGNIITVTGTGTVELTASQSGDGDFAPAPNVVRSFVVTACAPPLTPQTITFAPISDQDMCSVVFAVNPTASSGLSVTLAVTSGPATLSGNVITLTGTGSVTVQATQAGDGVFAAAPPVSRTFNVAACAPPLQSQTITFAPIADRDLCATVFTVNPTASSGLPVTLVVASGPATVSGNVVTLTGVGNVTLRATQGGDGAYDGAPPVSRTFAVGPCAPVPAPQTIAFAAVPNRGLCDAAFTLNPTSSSGLPVTLSVTSGPATVSGNTVTLTGEGSVTLRATQAGNGAYLSAPPVSQTFAAAKCEATITLQHLTNIFYGRDFNALEWITTTTSPAGLNVIITHNGSTTVPAAARSYTVVGTIDSPFYKGTVTDTLVIAADPRVAQSVNFGMPIIDRVFGDPPFTLNPTSSSGMATTLVVQSGPATVSGNTVTITGAGIVVLEVSQAGNIATDFFASLAQGFVVAKATVPILLSNLAQNFDGSPKNAVAVTTPAGLAVNLTYNGSATLPTLAGSYAVHASITDSNYQGSADATLVISSSRIVNFSTRALAGPGSEPFLMGFVVTGDSKNLLVRGVGPTLASYGITNALADPLLAVSGASGPIATNDDWQAGNDGPLIAATAASVGAFTLPNGSKDAALLVRLNHGAYTAGIARPPGSTGIAMAEIYDTDPAVAARLVNVSALMHVGTNDNILIAGFTITGNAPKGILIRAVGPTLSTFAVSGVLGDPEIRLYAGGNLVATNDNWETGNNAAQLTTTFAASGAFALPPGSKDAVLVATLSPGSYTVQVSGVANTTGVALVELYDLP